MHAAGQQMLLTISMKHSVGGSITEAASFGLVHAFLD